MQMEMRNVGQAITGYYPVPLRHGMTVGEIARYINGEYGIGAADRGARRGLARGQWFDETGLPWIDPSPNIRSLDAALTYAGLVLLEATNLTVGRGTDAPFSYVGAPWLDAAALLERAARVRHAGVALDTTLRAAGRGLGPLPRRACARSAPDHRPRRVPARLADARAADEIRRQHPPSSASPTTA
jgi:hypothetical protein